MCSSDSISDVSMEKMSSLWKVKIKMQCSSFYQCSKAPLLNYFLLIFSDLLSSVHGSVEEYDIPVWTRYMSDVWRQNAGMSHL